MDDKKKDELIELLLAVLLGYRDWEAAMLLSEEAWGGGMRALPQFTEELWDSFLELQTWRNIAVNLAKSKAVVNLG